MTFCDSTEGNRYSLWTHKRTNEGWTERCGSRNSYLDYYIQKVIEPKSKIDFKEVQPNVLRSVKLWTSVSRP